MFGQLTITVLLVIKAHKEEGYRCLKKLLLVVKLYGFSLSIVLDINTVLSILRKYI